MSKCCNIVYWKHDDGWDVFRRSDCFKNWDGSFVPTGFDCALIEDYPTKQAAIVEMKDWHKYGICLVSTAW